MVLKPPHPNFVPPSPGDPLPTRGDPLLASGSPRYLQHRAGCRRKIVIPFGEWGDRDDLRVEWSGSGRPIHECTTIRNVGNNPGSLEASSNEGNRISERFHLVPSAPSFDDQVNAGRLADLCRSYVKVDRRRSSETFGPCSVRHHPATDV